MIHAILIVVALLLLVPAGAEAIQATLNWNDDGSAQTRIERRDGPDTAMWANQTPTLLAPGVRAFNQAGLALNLRYCYRLIKTGEFGDADPTGWPVQCGTAGTPANATGFIILIAPGP